MYRLFVVIVFILTSFAVCYGAEKYKGGPHYFRDIKNGAAPYEPVEEINYEEANNLYTYYEAYFDDEGRIILLKKYRKGKLEWSDKYVYGPTGSLENRELFVSDKR